MEYREIISRFQVKSGGSERCMAICPCHNDKRASLSISRRDDRTLLHCHAGCETGDIVRAVGLELEDLFACPRGRPGKPEKPEKPRQPVNAVKPEIAVTPGPSQAEKPSHTVTAAYRYPNGCVKLRYDDKSFRWKHQLPDGTWEWSRKGVPHALYHGELLPDAEQVILAEGEKDADTLVNMGLTGVCTEDGASKSSQSPKLYPEYAEALAGKQVFILNDHDEAGIAHAEAAAAMLSGRAARVCRIPMDLLWPEVPEKGDISDYAAAVGAEAAKQRLLELMQSAVEWQPPAAENEDNPVWEQLGIEPLNTGAYRVTPQGLLRAKSVEDGKLEYKRFSSTPIVPVANYENVDTGVHRVKLRAIINQRCRDIVVDRAAISSNTRVVDVLASHGVDITSTTARNMIAFFSELQGCNALPYYASVGHLGWVEDRFVPYDEDGKIQFDGAASDKRIYNAVCSQKGTLEEWVAFTAPLRENMAVRITMAASFAAPLIKLLDAQPFLLHLWGTTGVGKTVALMLAMSPWGNPEVGSLISTTDNTNAAMCITAYFLQNLPFAADELQLIKKGGRKSGDNYDSIIMSLCEGVERGRATKDAEKRAQRTWRCNAIVTGEEPITAADSGGGAKNRAIELQCKRPLFRNAGEVALFVLDHHGTAGRYYIDLLKQTPLVTIRELYWEYRQELAQLDATEKQQAAAALILLADNLASLWLYPGEARMHAPDLAPYLKTRSEVSTSVRARYFVQDWIAQNFNRFLNDFDLEGTEGQNAEGIRSIGDTYGKLEKKQAFVIRQVLVSALQEAGFSFDAVKDDWIADGFLVRVEKNSHSDRDYTSKQLRLSYFRRTETGRIIPDSESQIRPRCCTLNLEPDWVDQAMNAETVGFLQ